MEQRAVRATIQQCDTVIEPLREAHERPDIALGLWNTRMLLLQVDMNARWDDALHALVKEGA